MSSNTNYLISGTTRGIGRGLVSALLQRPNTTIFAGVRDLNAETAKSLLTLPKADSSAVHLVRIDASDPSTSQAAIETLRSTHGVTHLDAVFANAGIFDGLAPTASVALADIQRNFEVNTLGPISLYQRSLPLLLAASTAGKSPKFALTTSALGSSFLSATPDFQAAPTVAYGVSKAGANNFFRKAAGEQKEISFVILHPGLVATDMGVPFSKNSGLPSISVEESVTGFLKVFDATGTEQSGKFVQWDGEELPF